MAKKEMTPFEASLFSEMKKLAKRANQRIVRLERETGLKEAFVVKNLADYLSIDTLDVWTEKGRIGVKKSLNVIQMKSVIKATENFLKQETSTVSGVKKYKENVLSKIPNKRNIKYRYINAVFQSEKNYNWIYEYYDSDFWNVARVCVKNGWSEEKFIDTISTHITNRSLDESLKFDLKNLYNYIQGVKA